jgi:hypothetical protein
MTPEEMETRITRLELRVDVLTATVHTMLPAIPQTSRASVLESFLQYHLAVERKMLAEDWPSREFDLMSAALEEAHSTRAQTLQMSDDQPLQKLQEQ